MSRFGITAAARCCYHRPRLTTLFVKMTDAAAQARYAAYSKLQTTAVASGENFFLPEIVAVGGQSDGKSSLLEAFLGFRFNVREVEMGTRRSAKPVLLALRIARYWPGLAAE